MENKIMLKLINVKTKKVMLKFSEFSTTNEWLRRELHRIFDDYIFFRTEKMLTHIANAIATIGFDEQKCVAIVDLSYRMLHDRIVLINKEENIYILDVDKGTYAIINTNIASTWSFTWDGNNYAIIDEEVQ